MHKIRQFILKYKKFVTIFLICLIILISGSILYYKKTHEIHPDFNKINLKGVNKLMIVAHPDDEILWGGEQLIKDNYLVVCVTCGTNWLRVNEFVDVMHATNDKYIMLGYPDKTNGVRDDWETVKDDIEKDIDAIVHLKKWQLIVVHNPDGEYGHKHHKMTSAITTNVVEDKRNLYYFGRYSSKKYIHKRYNEMVAMDDATLRKKKQIIGLYRTQKFIQTAFNQMFPYENWLSYEEWNGVKNEN